VVKEVRGIKVLTGDSFAVPAAVMLAIGRLACFCSGCCYGLPTTLPWGVTFSLPNRLDVVPRHPTQLYEVLFHLLAAGCLLTLEKYDLLKGQRLKAYLLTYCIFRFFTEWLRPEPILLLSLTAYQWAALILIIPLLIQWHIHAQRLKHQPAQSLEESLPPNIT
jgi:prolipoprotein diacylglyceryltransferase